MTLRILATSRFKKDLKRIQARHLDTSKLHEIIKKLANQEPLPSSNRDHALVGNLKQFRECHIEPDWLLMYKIDNDCLVLTLVRTGTHSDLKLK